jgi:lysozyme family protein
MSAGFDDAFSRLIGHEGGLSDHAADPGGLTNWGISQRSYPGEDIRAMTMNRAREIYLRDFWGPAGCDMVPAGVAFDLFDLAVNSGVKTSIKMLQRATGETQDGILGPLTLQAAQSMPAARLRARLNGHRLAMMADLPTWPSFGRGWARRIASNLVEV